MIVGSEGFVAWFYGVTWKTLKNASKNIYAKYTIHTVGLIFCIVGLYPILQFLNPILQFAGLALFLGGMVIFITPFGVEKEN